MFAKNVSVGREQQPETDRETTGACVVVSAEVLLYLFVSLFLLLYTCHMHLFLCPFFLPFFTEWLLFFLSLLAESCLVLPILASTLTNTRASRYWSVWQ